MPLYSTGIRKPAKGTILAPSALWTLVKGVVFMIFAVGKKKYDLLSKAVQM
jgi:hypothetical protein